jgi:beta-lactamase regulating signal transducer with metallopeptidase domain
VDVVLNWLMQGVMVAIVAAGALRLMPRSRAQARYGVLWTAYLLLLALPAVPIVLAIALGGRTADVVPAAASPVVTMPITWWTSPVAAVGLWIVWACIQAARLAVSALGVRHTRRRGRECPASVLARLPHWSRISETGRRTRVILSSEVRAAAVLGCGKPAIALAPTLVEQLSVTDLDRVLVHEWAHVQRRDDVAQLAQRFVSILIGWHPAAWWLERQLEFEREAACDEIAVSVTGSARGYATCLAMLAARPETRLRSVGALAAASPSRLRPRIVRILAAPSGAAARPWRAITVAAGSVLLMCTVIVADLQLVVPAVTSAVASTAEFPPATEPEPVVAQRTVASRSTERTDADPRPLAARRRVSRVSQRPATPEPERSPRVAETEMVGEPPTPAAGPALLTATELPVDPSASLIATARASERPGEQPRALWTLAADVGVDVGRASQTAGTATAGFFKRFGKSVAGAF